MDYRKNPCLVRQLSRIALTADAPVIKTGASAITIYYSFVHILYHNLRITVAHAQIKIITFSTAMILY